MTGMEILDALASSLRSKHSVEIEVWASMILFQPCCLFHPLFPWNAPRYVPVV